MPPPPLQRVTNNLKGINKSEDLRELIVRKLEIFAFNVSVVGVRSMVEHSQTRKEKLMWMLLVLFGVIIALVQIQDRLNYFQQYPTSSTAIIENNDEIRFPQVTICNENQMKRSVAVKAGLVKVLTSMFPSIEGPHIPTPNLTIFNNWTTEMFQSLEQNITIDALQNIQFCAWKTKQLCDVPKWFKPINTDMGLCFTFNAGDINLTSSDAGESEGLMLAMNTSQSEYLVAIHDQKEIPRMRDLGLQVTVGFSTSMAVSQTKSSQLPYPYGNCNDTPGYTETACYIDCKTRYIVKRCNCRNAYMPGNAPRCNIVQQYKCTVKAETDFISGSVSCACPSQCHSTSYDVTTSQSVFSDFALAFVSEQLYTYLNASTTVDDLRSNSAVVQIYFSTMQSVTLRTDPAYTLMALLSDIGGALGLMLGATLLTIVEVAQFALSLIVDVIRVRRERSKQTSSQKCQTLSRATINVIRVNESLSADDGPLY